MSWVFLLIILTIPKSIAATVLIRVLAATSQKSRRYLLMYFMQFLLTSFLILIFPTDYSRISLLPFLMGLLNSFGTYCQWEAMALSVSKTSILMVADDILPILLALMFLGEFDYLNGLLCLGATGCVAACIVQVVNRPKERNDSASEWKRLILWSLGFGIPWGIVVFVFRYANIESHLSWTEFGWPYYLGSFLMAIFVNRRFAKKGEITPNHTVSSSVFYLLIFFSACINVLCFVLSYVLYGKAPIVWLQPLLLVEGAIFPVLVGYYILNEELRASKFEKRAILGSLLLALLGMNFIIAQAADTTVLLLANLWFVLIGVLLVAFGRVYRPSLRRLFLRLGLET